MSQDLKRIKKKYGENMSRLCRNLFPSLLEKEGLLFSILSSNFETSRSLYKDIIENDLVNNFKEYIYSVAYESDLNKQEAIRTETPKELLSRAGYYLFECNTEEELQSFKKYYKKEEALCTFLGGRLKHCHVFFAVKKDVEKIKREDFPSPKRQDEYGTSVISIQFTRDPSHTLSIKNRYNYTVENPDATFSNDLDNIIAGLTESFENEYGLIQKNKKKGFEIPGYVQANDGKFYKYNYEIGNIYYCPNNVIIDNFEVKRFPKEKYVILDYFILDLVNKKLSFYDNSLSDSFVDTIHNIEKTSIVKKENNKKAIIVKTNRKEISIVINGNNEIVEYSNPNLEEVGNEFLYLNKVLKKFEAPSLQEMGNNCLYYNKALEELELTSLRKVGHYFLWNNRILKKLDVPNLEKAGNNCLRDNELLEKLTILKLQETGNEFLFHNNELKELEAPNLQKVGDNFLFENKVLEKLVVPNLQKTGEDFLFHNKALKESEAPNSPKERKHILSKILKY